jgi:restriction endonuclease S subunit
MHDLQIVQFLDTLTDLSEVKRRQLTANEAKRSAQTPDFILGLEKLSQEV